VRPRTIVLALAVTCGLLTGCGGGASRSLTKGAGAVTKGAAPTGTSLTKSQALAFAREVNLTAADVPGFTVSAAREKKLPRERHAEREMLRCTGSGGPAGGFPRASSKDFEFKHDVVDLSVSSEVGVAPTAAVAGEELAAIRGARIRGCFSRYLDELFVGEQFGGAAVKPVKIEAGTPPAPGTTGSFGWRVTATLTLHRLNISFYMDMLGFVYGPARVTLFSSGALVPFPAQIQQRLFSLLLARAHAYRP
jgi:hypothetical protein